MPDTRKAAILGGNRIPFARSNGAYCQGLQPGPADRRARRARRALRPRRRAARRGRRRRRRQARPRHQPDPRVGARHQARARDARPTTSARPAAPAWRRRSSSPTRSSSARSTRRSRAAPTRPRTRRSPSPTSSAPCCTEINSRPLHRRPAQGADEAAPGDAARHPQERRAAHRPVDGRAHGDHGEGVGPDPRRAGRARRRQPPAPRRRLRPRLHGRPGHPVPGARARRQPAPRLDRSRSWRS